MYISYIYIYIYIYISYPSAAHREISVVIRTGCTLPIYLDTGVCKRSARSNNTRYYSEVQMTQFQNGKTETLKTFKTVKRERVKTDTTTILSEAPLPQISMLKP